MNRAYTIGREMTNSEKQAWLNGVSLVKRVEVVKKQSVAQPSNIEAIVEGLLYIVGELKNQLRIQRLFFLIFRKNMLVKLMV